MAAHIAFSRLITAMLVITETWCRRVVFKVREYFIGGTSGRRAALALIL